MCGLVGVIGDNISLAAYEKLFANLLIADGVRGLHSTGAIAAKKDACRWYKDTIAGAEMVADPSFAKWQRENTAMKCLLGHNRYATMGAHSVKNAHPFDEGNITLMHNGTLRNWRRLEGAWDFDVDSNYIAYLINKEGAHSALSQLVGAWALVWVDNTDNTLNFCRNDERPLWFARLRSKAGKQEPLNKWVYGSEKGMLTWLIERNGMETSNFFQLKPGKLMTFDLDSNMSEFSVTSLEYTAYEEDKKKPKTTNAYGQYGYASGGYTSGGRGRSVVPFPPAESAEVVPGVKLHDSVSFWPTHFVPLQSSGQGKHGTLYGYMATEPFLPVRINYVHRNKFKDITWNEKMNAFTVTDGEYSSTALRVTTDQEDSSKVLVLSAGTLSVDAYFSTEGNASGLPQAVALKNFFQEEGTQDVDPMAGLQDLDDLGGAERARSTTVDVDDEELGLEGYGSYVYTGQVPGPGGVLIDAASYVDIVKCGCANCRAGVGVEDCDDIEWLNYEDFLCMDCSNFMSSQQKDAASG